jgi:hypothetical protein
MMEMDAGVARERLEAYRAQLRRSWDEEHAAVARGLEAIAEGTPVLSLSQAIQSGGLFGDGRPKLAVARADRRQVEVWRFSPGLFRFSALRRSGWGYEGSLRLDVDAAGMDHPDRMSRGYSLVPLVPPEVLRVCGGRSRLREHFTLWEVEEWSDRPFLAQPPEDPLLLRALGGELYAVVAAWDLTDLERAVMAGRRES